MLRRGRGVTVAQDHASITRMGRLGRLAFAKRAGWFAVQMGRQSNVEVGQTSYPVNRGG